MVKFSIYLNRHIFIMRRLLAASIMRLTPAAEKLRLQIMNEPHHQNICICLGDNYVGSKGPIHLGPVVQSVISLTPRTSNLRKLRTVLFVNEWILSYFCVILSWDCVYSCSLLRRFAEICVFTKKFPYIRRNIFVAVYKRTEQSPHSERSTS